jgi:hypothetical protein
MLGDGKVSTVRNVSNARNVNTVRNVRNARNVSNARNLSEFECAVCLRNECAEHGTAVLKNVVIFNSCYSI